MRLGQILVEAQLITAKQLSFALEYASSKTLFLGRALTLLRYLREEDIARALQAQDLINMEMAPPIVLDALQTAVQGGSSLQAALEKRHAQRISIATPAPRKPETPYPAVIDNSPAGLISAGDSLLLKDYRREAETVFKQALTELENRLGKDHIELAPVLVRLGNTYLALSSFEQARGCYESVLFLRTKHLPDNHLEIAQTFESLADLYTAELDESRAMWAYLSAIDVLEKRLPGQLVSYTRLLRKLAAAMEAPEAGRKVPVGEILKAAGLLSEEHLSAALSMSKRASQPLGVVLRENGMVRDREFQSALKAQFCIKHGVLSEPLAVNLLARASRRGITLERVLHEAGLLASDEVTEIYRVIASELDQLVAAESSEISARPQIAPIACRLGALYEQAGDKPQAEIYYSRAISCWSVEACPDMALVAVCSSLVALLQEQNRLPEARPHLLTILEHRRAAAGDTDEQTMQAAEDVAQVDLLIGNVDAALNRLQDIVTLREVLNQEGPQLLRSVILSGDCLRFMKNVEGAEATYKAALGLARSPEGEPTLALTEVIERIADLYADEGYIPEALALDQQALAIARALDAGDKRIEELQHKVNRLESQ